jgi:hypothetical protein
MSKRLDVNACAARTTSFSTDLIGSDVSAVRLNVVGGGGCRDA